MKGTNNMIKAGFAGFGEVNTPIEILEEKCGKALGDLNNAGVDTVSVFPITDDFEEKDIEKAVKKLKSEDFDFLVVCIAGWIPTHAVIKVCEHFRNKPMVLWGLCGWIEDGRIVTTADQAGTSALRKTFFDMGYTFKYIYDIIGKESSAKRVAAWGSAACAAEKLRHSRVFMGGYRDMNLYGTLYDGASLKRTIGTEIETMELMDIEKRLEGISDAEVNEVIDKYISKWHFLKEGKRESMEIAAKLYLAVSALVRERKCDAVSLKDVDGMKKLFGFPPAPVFMLLSDVDKLCTIPENDCLGAVTQLMVKYLTGQCAAYLEFYEYFEDGVLMGVPDYVPAEVTDGETKVMPAAFGELSEGILNVSKLKTGTVTLCRLTHCGDSYYMHMELGVAETPQKWEEAGWTQPAPQLPGLKIKIRDTEDFVQNVMCQHYIISYGDNTDKIKDLCDILGIEIL